MTQDEGGMVHATLVVTRADNVSTWTWTVGECTVSLSFPVPEGEALDPVIYRDLEFLVYQLPELIASGVQEAEVQVLMQELEEDLDGLQAPEG